MRIGFDVSVLPRPGSGPPDPQQAACPPGVVRATRGLVEALEARRELEIVRLAPEPGEDPRRWRHRRLPELVRELDLFGLHSPVSAFPLRGPGKRLQTIHELPWLHGVRENADLKHRFWARLGSRRADLVICPSAHVARAVGPRATVCPWGVEERFTDEPGPGEVDEVLLARYSLGEDPLALCLGATRAKKNLEAFLRGMAELQERSARRGERAVRLQAVVTGEHTPQLRRDLGTASKLGLARFVSTPGSVEDPHLPGLLRLAALVPVLSRSEGFAFPVLEALACGTPVLVPPDSAQAELAGDAGIVVRPDDPSSVADGIERALAERQTAIPARIERAAAFTWERCARTVVELWSSLA